MASVRRAFHALLGLVLVLLCATGLGHLGAAGAQTAPPFQDVRFAGGLNQPTAMALASDGRIFVTEQGGALRVVKDGALLTAPFLTVPVVSSNERGLLGVTFDPSFASNGFVYVYYTANTNPIVNRVSRFTVSATDPDRANPASETVIVNDIPSENGYHNGGALHFGADGKLYIAVGESHNGSNAQSLTSLAGKILRFNANGTVPTDNPFYATTTGNSRAIWALGLRNPFTFDIQPGTGRIFVNDVGQSTWEEVDEAWIGPNDGSNAGFNFGWPTTEGPTTDARYHPPFHAYTHSDGCAITGGAFYNPSTVNFPPEYVGDYFFADYCGGWVKSIDLSTKTVSTLIAPGDAGQPVDIKVDADGSLYYLDRATDPSASVHRVRFDQSLVAPVNTVRPALSGTARDGQTVQTSTGTWTGTAPITYTFAWRRCDTSGNNCVTIPSATSQSYVIVPADVGSKLYALVTATNAAGSASQRTYLSGTVLAAPPLNTVRPALSGTARDGQTVQTSTGTWTGTAPITYTFAWRRCDTSGNNCVTIPSATSQSYVIVPADVGSKLYALVTATNAAGSASQRTYLSGTVLAAPPLNTVRPALSGTARDGQTVQTSTGTWTGTAPITYTFAWRRCDTSGNNCVTIPSATSQSYVIVPADVGSKLYALVTATNAAGSASQRTYLSAVVAAT